MSLPSPALNEPRQTPETPAAETAAPRPGWAELFFDLVFVALIATAAHLLVGEPTGQATVVFLIVLFPAWWAWANLMVTSNLFGNNPRRTGALLVAAMPGIAMMTIAMPDALGDMGWLYSAGGALVRLVLFAGWIRPGLDRPQGALVLRAVGYNLVTATLWIVAAFQPAPARVVLWAAAIIIELVMLIVQTGVGNQIYRRLAVSHLVERVGLFVVIVLGESVYLTVMSLQEHLTVEGAVAGIAGFIASGLLARSFFSLALSAAEARLEEAQKTKRYGAMRDSVMLLPFIVIAALTAMAASIGTVVEHPTDELGATARWILQFGVTGFYVASGLVGLRLGEHFMTVLIWQLPGVVLSLAVVALFAAAPGWILMLAVAAGVIVIEAIGMTRRRILANRMRAAVNPAAV